MLGSSPWKVHFLNFLFAGIAIVLHADNFNNMFVFVTVQLINVLLNVEPFYFITAMDF